MPERPTLTTARLVLRPFTVADALDVQQLAGAREVASTTLLIPHPYEPGMAEQWISTHQERYERGELVSFAIVCAALYWLAYKPVLRMLEARRQQIATGLANTEKINAALANIESQRQSIMAEAQAQSTRLIAEARDIAKRLQEQEAQRSIVTAEQIMAFGRGAWAHLMQLDAREAGLNFLISAGIVLFALGSVVVLRRLFDYWLKTFADSCATALPEAEKKTPRAVGLTWALLRLAILGATLVVVAGVWGIDLWAWLSGGFGARPPAT